MMTNLINAEKNMLTILNRKKRMEKKDKIKVANKEKRTELLPLIARENEEKISKEKERPNILCKSYENTNELKKVFQGPFILCENCKDTFSPNSILVHISRSKVCKSHYGEKYDEIRDIMRTENMRRTSKEAWQVIKQEKDLQKEKEKKEISEELAKNSMEFFESKSRKKNSIWRKKLNWVNGCFQHLFDNYSEININVKEKMLQIQSSIDNLYQEIEIRIDKVVGIVKNFDCQVKVKEIIRENGLQLHEIQHEWELFQQYKLGEEIEKILDDVEETDKNKEWYAIVEKIQERFKERFKGWWVENYHKFTKQTSCIICHKVPNCLNEYNLSKEETKVVMFTVY